MSDFSDAEMEKSFIEVEGHRMAYAATGEGAPVLFVHGNPTSSYLWRNIMPHVADRHRAIAPDLIGMGDSDKLADSGPGRYSFTEHKRFLDAFLERILPDEKIALVVHDWGSALGFHWARRNPERVRGICFMEAIVAPFASWEEFPEAARPVFQGFRSDAGEQMVLDKNLFVERVLPGSILRDLGDAEMAVYRKPFAEPGEGRRPTLTWPRQIPIDGQPADVVQIVEDYGHWLAASDVPKLFVNAEPGAILGDTQRALVRSWPNLTEVTVRGVHFVQEDSPHEIGQALRDWLATLPE